ncbi:MAG: RNA polymerase sigma factor [Planctomycetota bacterium]
MMKGKTKTSQYLQQWNAGDADGLQALLERHLPWIYEHVPKRLGPLLRLKADVSDYVQDVVVQFLQYGPRIQISDDEHFRALLIRIVENALRDKHDWFTARRRAYALDHPQPSDTVLSLDPPAEDPVATPSKVASRHEDEAWIHLGLELIDPEERELIVLRQWDELPFDEIGKRIGVSQDAAWKRHNRAVHHLAEKVGELRRRRIDCLMEESSS